MKLSQIERAIRRAGGTRFIRSNAMFKAAPRRARRAQARMLHKTRMVQTSWQEQWATTALMYQRICSED